MNGRNHRSHLSRNIGSNSGDGAGEVCVTIFSAERHFSGLSLHPSGPAQKTGFYLSHQIGLAATSVTHAGTMP